MEGWFGFPIVVSEENRENKEMHTNETSDSDSLISIRQRNSPSEEDEKERRRVFVGSELFEPF
jgi:hypothetical protein